jgi:hypothetical protein
MYCFRTMNDTKEIFYYDEGKGIYVGGAEIVRVPSGTND